MTASRPIHPDFQFWLGHKEKPLIELFTHLREHILTRYPESMELLYHTHALTAVFSTSERLGDAFCMIPIYTNHLNLGFNKGTLLPDPQKLLTGTGNLIRHIPVSARSDYEKPAVTTLLEDAVNLAVKDMDKPAKLKGQTISKIKKS